MRFFLIFGPEPGSFDIILINSSIFVLNFCIYVNGHLKPGIPKPPVAFEISSVVLLFNFSFCVVMS